MTAPCPQRHLHADHITPLMIAEGYMLSKCPCGRRYVVKIKRERN